MVSFTLRPLKETIKKMETMEKYSFDSHNHVHKFGDNPLIGTSTVSSVLSKPLTWWASGKACEVLGWSKKDTKYEERLETASKVLNVIKGMSNTVYLTLLDKAYKAHSEQLKEAADKGTDLHFVLETYVKAKIFGRTPEVPEQIADFAKWCDKNVKRFIFSEINVYSSVMWTGGISDCGVELNDGRYGIIDFKSAKDAYFEHYIQCGGYCLQLEENGGFSPEGEKTFELDKPISFFAIVPFGNKDKTPRIKTNVEDFKDSFKAALQIYKAKQKFAEEYA